MSSPFGKQANGENENMDTAHKGKRRGLFESQPIRQSMQWVCARSGVDMYEEDDRELANMSYRMFSVQLL